MEISFCVSNRDDDLRGFEPYQRMMEDLSLERRKGVDGSEASYAARSFSSLAQSWLHVSHIDLHRDLLVSAICQSANLSCFQLKKIYALFPFKVLEICMPCNDLQPALVVLVPMVQLCVTVH
jgi:hypothetical protein